MPYLDVPSYQATPPPPPGYIRLINEGGRLGAINPDGSRQTVALTTDATGDIDTRLPFDGVPVTFVPAEFSVGTYSPDEGVDCEVALLVEGLSGQVAFVLAENSGDGCSIMNFSGDAGNSSVTVGLDFTGGTGEEVVTTTLTELKAVFDADGRLSIDIGTDGATACIVATVDVNGATYATIGTPARACRQATDGTYVWTAMVDDPTGTNAATWVKTFTPLA